MYNPVAILPRSKLFEKKQVFMRSFDFFFMKNVSKRPNPCLEKKSFCMLFHHGTLKWTFSQDCLFFFFTKFKWQNNQNGKKKIDDDKKKMVEQKKSREKLFLYNQLFSWVKINKSFNFFLIKHSLFLNPFWSTFA